MSKQQAVDDIRKLGRTLKGLIDFADEIERVGSLENAAKEAESRIEKFKKDQAKAEIECLAAQEKAAEMFEKANGIVPEAEEKAGAIIEKAMAKADEIVSQATTKAFGIKAKSDADRAEMANDVVNFKEARALMVKEKSELESMISMLKAELADLKKRIG